MTEQPNESRREKTPAEPELAKEQAEQKLLTNIIMVCLAPAILCAVLGIYCFILGYQKLNGGGSDLGAWGNFGSYLQGTTGSLWALAGVFIIFVAFLMQLRQLKEQKEQFRLQFKQQEVERAEEQKQIQAQSQQFQAQQESIKRQNFESSFFQLLNLQNQITAGLRCTDRFSGPKTSRECFQTWLDYLRQEFVSRQVILTENDLGHIREAYQVFYRGAQAALAHYFRNLYHAIKFVKSSDISDKRRYTSLVRAQLSAYELTLLFYNGLSVFGEGFKPLIEEFGLLEHLDDSLLMERSHRQLYAESAYQ
jgi:hypothetical protein